MTRVLVTGGTGFLGRHLVRALRARGCEVRVLARSTASRSRVREDLEAAGAQLVTGDLLDRASVRAAVSGASTVFHLAGRLLEPGVPARMLALDSARRLALPLSVARPALVYGPGDHHLAGWFRAIQSGAYRIVGSGDNLLHPIYVGDAVDGLLRCAERQRAGIPRVDLGRGLALTVDWYRGAELL